MAKLIGAFAVSRTVEQHYTTLVKIITKAVSNLGDVLSYDIVATLPIHAWISQTTGGETPFTCKTHSTGSLRFCVQNCKRFNLFPVTSQLCWTLSLLKDIFDINHVPTADW